MSATTSAPTASALAETRPTAARRPQRRKAIWRDPVGRFSWLKTITLLIVIYPGALLAAEWATDSLGPRPVTQVIHGTGDWAARFLMLSLAVTPARVVLDWPRVVLLRRILGVTAAAYAVAHLILYCVDQNWNMLKVVSEIVVRFYLTIGFVTLLGLVTLAATSTDGMMRRLGRRWKKLHRIVFGLGVLAVFHYALQSKADVTDAVFLTGLFVWLLLWRITTRAWQGRVLLLPVLAIASGLITAGIEAAWYGLKTGAPAMRVLAANLDVGYGLRPAVEVAVLGLALTAVAGLRRVRRPRRAGPAVA